MKQVMTDYINSMTEGNLDSLEQIISLQYRKFIRFYRLVEGYSELIKNLKYEFNSPTSLDVLLVLESKAKPENIKKEIEASMSESKYDGEVKLVKKNVFISIILDE